MSASPPLDKLRYARVADRSRLGIVATASFYHSPVFHYLRPNWRAYLDDSIASYAQGLEDEILEKKTVVLVAEDDYDENESQHVFKELQDKYPPIADQVPAKLRASGKVIVGAVSLFLGPDKERYGKFNPEGDNPPKPGPDPNDQKRDISLQGLEIYNRLQDSGKQRWFVGHMEITAIDVHPAYWRRGHGETLAKWCIELANMDKIPMSVSAAPMGVNLFLKLGFEEKESIELDGYDEHPQPIHLWLGLREAKPIEISHATVTASEVNESTSWFNRVKDVLTWLLPSFRQPAG